MRDIIKGGPAISTQHTQVVKFFTGVYRADGRTMQMGTITSLDIFHTMTHMIDPPPGQEFSKFPKLSFLFYSFKNVKSLFSESLVPSRSELIVLSNTEGLFCVISGFFSNMIRLNAEKFRF